MLRYPSIGHKTRQILATQFSVLAQRAQRRAERAKATGDHAAWARHMNNASLLALKAEMLGG